MELSANLCEIANYRPKTVGNRAFAVIEKGYTVLVTVTRLCFCISGLTGTEMSALQQNSGTWKLINEAGQDRDFAFFHGAQKRNPSSATSSLRHCPHEPLPWTLAISWYWGNVKKSSDLVPLPQFLIYNPVARRSGEGWFTSWWSARRLRLALHRLQIRSWLGKKRIRTPARKTRGKNQSINQRVGKKCYCTWWAHPRWKVHTTNH